MALRKMALALHKSSCCNEQQRVYQQDSGRIKEPLHRLMQHNQGLIPFFQDRYKQKNSTSLSEIDHLVFGQQPRHLSCVEIPVTVVVPSLNRAARPMSSSILSMTAGLLYKLPSLTHVPGVPEIVQTQDLGCPTKGKWLMIRSPRFQWPEVGVELE
jgi:hypothetical protein